MQINTGSIAKGHEADLVILSHNPLEDINHTRNIEAVIANGKLLSKPTLDAMLDAVKQANDASRNIPIDAYIN